MNKKYQTHRDTAVGERTHDNALIGRTPQDTLINIRALVMLLKCLDFKGDINAQAEYGLFLIYSLIQDAIDVELEWSISI